MPAATFTWRVTGRATPQTPFLGSVPQYAANYVELPSINGEAAFSGEPSVDLVSVPVDSSGIWWSNRGDNLDSKITRHVDLTGAAQATLRFRAWYDLEKQFDFVYLSASRDDGRSWQVLHAQHTSPDRSAGNNYGEGWTGSTGAGWVDEQVDLTPFAGSSILLRFEYVTDQSYNGRLCLQRPAHSRLGLDEPGAVEHAWNAEGWLRVDAPIPERWNLRLVRWTRAETTVEPVAVDADGHGDRRHSIRRPRAVLVIAPTAPRTLVRRSRLPRLPSESSLFELRHVPPRQLDVLPARLDRLLDVRPLAELVPRLDRQDVSAAGDCLSQLPS